MPVHDGRYHLWMIVVQLFVIFVETFVSTTKITIASTSVSWVAILVTVLMSVRLTPFMTRWFSVLICGLLGLCLGVATASVSVSASGSWWGYFGLLAIPVCVLLPIIASILRYVLLRRLSGGGSQGSLLGTGNRRSSSSWWLVCSGSFDLAILLSCVEDGRRVEMVLNILQDPKVTKSKGLSHMLIPLVLDSPLICANILSHAKSLRRKACLHDESALAFYREKIAERRALGGVILNSEGTNTGVDVVDVRVSRQLSQLRQEEDQLQKLYQFVLGQIISRQDENGGRQSDSVIFEQFGQALSQIAAHRQHCEKTYAILMETHTTSRVLRRFAAFANLFLNDAELADRCIKEADNIRRIQPTDPGLRGDAAASASCDLSTVSATDSEGGYIGDDTDTSLESENSESDVESLDERQCGCAILSDDQFQPPTRVAATARTIRISSSGGEIELGTVPRRSRRLNRRNRNRNRDHPALDGFSVGAGTVISKDTYGVSSSVSSRSLRSKLRQIRVWPACCLRVTFCAFLLSLVGVFVASFVLFFLMNARFAESSLNIEHASRARERVTRASLYLRRMQIAFYNETRVPLESERDADAIRAVGAKACSDMSLVYQNTPAIGEAWQNTVFELNERLVQDNVTFEDHDHSAHMYHPKNYSIFDAVTATADHCIHAFEQSDAHFAWQEFSHTHDFVFVTMNEALTQHHLLGVIFGFLESERQFATTQCFIFLTLCLSLLVFVPLFLCGCCWYSVAYSRSFRGVNLVQRDHLFRLYSRFSGKLDDLGNSRVAINQTSTIQSFTIVAVLIVILAAFVLAIFPLMSFTASQKFSDRNREYLHACRLKTDVNRIHMNAREVLYRYKSLLHRDAVHEALLGETVQVQHKLEELRFGSDSEHLPGNDRVRGVREIYYESTCPPDTNWTALSLPEYLRCQTLVRQVALLVSASLQIEECDEFDADAIDDFRDSEAFRTIIALDADLNGTGRLTGILQEKIRSVRSAGNAAFQEVMALFENLALLVLLIATPILAFFAYALLWRPALKLSVDMRQMRELIVLLPSHVIYSDQALFDYLRGQSTVSKLRVFQKKKSDHHFIHILEKSAYACLWFDKKKRILAYNEQAADILGLTNSTGRTLDDVFSRESLEGIVAWMAKKYTEQYSGTLRTSSSSGMPLLMLKPALSLRCQPIRSFRILVYGLHG